MGDDHGLADSSLIEGNIHFLILSADAGKSSQQQRRALLTTANKQQITCLVEVAFNILYGNIDLTADDKQRLKRYRRQLRRLVSKSTKLVERREILRPPLVRALLKPITKKLVEHFCSNINSKASPPGSPVAGEKSLMSGEHVAISNNSDDDDDQTAV